MGFVDYSAKFFKEKLNSYESLYKDNAPKSIVHEAKVLLKLLDDIRNEGYEDVYTYINRSCDAASRLKIFITSNNDKPFVINKYNISKNIAYESHEYKLENYLNLIERKITTSGSDTTKNTPEIFYDILSYSKDIFMSSNSETAYCFLLRDTLLPYLAFKKWDTKNNLNIVPMLISRRLFSFFEREKEELYTHVQNIIFEALDENIQTFEQLKKYVRDSLKNAPLNLLSLISLIKRKLSDIPQKNIMVLESGYIGTMPVLLSAIDDRIDFKMFTTIPCFYELYKEKFFTKSFEKIRLFETIQCQDALFKLMSINSSGCFMVSETSDNKIKDKAYQELNMWYHLINSNTCKY